MTAIAPCSVGDVLYDVLTDILLASLVVFIAGCCLAFVAAVLGLNRRRPRVASPADLGQVSGQWLDERGRTRRQD